MEIVSAFQGHPDFAGRFLNQGLHVEGYLSINTHKVRYRHRDDYLKMIFSRFHWLIKQRSLPKTHQERIRIFLLICINILSISSWDVRYKLIVFKI